MKIVILCGGQGTRIRDVSEVLPKPMLPIGNQPILWHIMKIYAHYGFTDFVLCLGHKGWVIKDFFLNYQAKMSDISLKLGQANDITYHNQNNEADWNVTLVDTGELTQTGSRIARVKKYLQGDEHFCVTYGDGVTDINIQELVDAHKQSDAQVTVSGVQPLGRFGEIEISDENHITAFNEKPNVSTGMINGGFMVFNTETLDKYFDAQADLSLESDIIPKIVQDNQVCVFKHAGAWQCVDTPREYSTLNKLWSEDKAFWKKWS